jgi:hypothetical protein
MSSPGCRLLLLRRPLVWTTNTSRAASTATAKLKFPSIRSSAVAGNRSAGMSSSLGSIRSMAAGYVIVSLFCSIPLLIETKKRESDWILHVVKRDMCSFWRGVIMMRQLRAADHLTIGIQANKTLILACF